MITFELPIRVRYKETDAMGVVHHSNYVIYYEAARTEMLRHYGTTYRALEECGVMMPVLGVEMKFIAPAYYDDLLMIRIILEKMPVVKMEFRHEIYNQKGELINTGTVLLAFMNSTTRRACRAPGWFTDILEKAMQEGA